MLVNFIKNMYNKAEVRKQIIQYLKSVGSGENIVQAIKQALFLNQDFNPLLLFELLSKGKQKITRDDWKKFLISRNIGFSDKQIRYFFRHCRLGEETTLNQFLETMIPYNADVLRQFKAKYLQSLQIQEFSPEIEFIFIELMRHWIDFFRNLIQIRSEISRTVSKRQIEHLVKQDLVLQSKPREARKFHELFQQSTFQLSFNQIRKFLQLWLSQEEINHEFYLLNVKRHIKSDDPFKRIVYRTRHRNVAGGRSRSRSRSVSASRSISNSRSVSRRKQDGTGLRRRSASTDKKSQKKQLLRQPQQSQPNVQQNGSYRGIRGNKESKYEDFKKQLQNSLLKQQFNMGERPKERGNPRKNIKINQKRSSNEQDDQGQSNSRNNRSDVPFNNQLIQKGNKESVQRVKTKEISSKDSQIVVKMFQEIVLKEDRIQKLRKQLAKTSDFGIPNLFKIIDSSSKGYINSQDLAVYYAAGANYSDIIVNFYARERGKLKLEEFSSIFRPLSKQLNEKLESRQSMKQGSFKKQTTRLIYEILQLQGQMHSNLNNLKSRIKQEGINPKMLFQFTDGQGKGYITSQNIKQILEENNIHTEPKDIKCFMKLFKKRIEERILEKEFLNFIDF